MTGAKTATITKPNTITAPTSSSFPMRRTSGCLREPDARVEPRVQEINQQVRDDDEERREQNRAHDERDVEIEDRLERQSADAGPIEDRFSEHHSREQPRKVESRQSHERQH